MASRMVVVHSSDELYGADRVVLEVVDAAPEDLSLEVWLPTDVPHPERTLCEALEAHGTTTVRHVGMPVLRRVYRTPTGLLGLARAAVRCWRALRSARADVLYCATSATLVCAPLARVLGTRHVVGHVQELWSGSDRVVLGLLARSCHRLVCISEAVRDALPPALRGRAVVVLNATPEPPAAQVSDVGTHEGPLHYLVASRWNAWKGHKTLLAAWDRLDSPGLLTVLGGPPPAGARTDVVGLVAGLRRPETVRVVGEVADVGGYVEAADVVVVPSDEPEPFGLVAIEALARGRAVVASGAGGVAAVVEPGVTGWLYPPRDDQALASLLAALDRAQVVRAGRAARAAYESTYTPAAFAAAWRTATGLSDRP